MAFPITPPASSDQEIPNGCHQEEDIAEPQTKRVGVILMRKVQHCQLKYLARKYIALACWNRVFLVCSKELLFQTRRKTISIGTEGRRTIKQQRDHGTQERKESRVRSKLRRKQLQRIRS